MLLDHVKSSMAYQGRHADRIDAFFERVTDVPRAAVVREHAVPDAELRAEPLEPTEDCVVLPLLTAAVEPDESLGPAPGQLGNARLERRAEVDDARVTSLVLLVVVEHDDPGVEV